MKILLIGASGTVGRAVEQELDGIQRLRGAADDAAGIGRDDLEIDLSIIHRGLHLGVLEFQQSEKVTENRLRGLDKFLHGGLVAHGCSFNISNFT